MTADTMHAAALPKQPSMRRLIVAATVEPKMPAPLARERPTGQQS
jgi:hypothetical protein